MNNVTCLDATALETCVSAAVAATAVHGTQPWRVRLDPETVTFQVRATPGPETTDLNLHLSAGACVLNLRVAMTHFGWHPVVRLLPSPEDPDLLATVRPTEPGPGTEPAADGGHSDLYEAVWRRHSTKLPLSEAPLPDGLCAELAEAARTEGARLDFPGAEESVRLLRLHAQAGHRDRVLAEGPRRARSEPDRSTTGPLALLTTGNDRHTDWLRAGQALEHVLLRATAHGLRTGLLYRATEWPDLRGALPAGPGHAHMLLRIGYGIEGPGRPVGTVPQARPEYS
ncbi:hypothetical protein [Streptomyces sp. YIM S03343]